MRERPGILDKCAAIQRVLVARLERQPPYGDHREELAGMRLMTGVAALIGTIALAGSASAAGLGQPDPWQMGLQEAASPIMERIASLHDGLLWLITAISIFVLLLLA